MIYSKGSWVIHMLREMLRQPSAKDPDARFVALLRTISTKYAYRAFSTDDLQREVEAVMTPAMDLEGGRSMEWFFEQWVRGTGIPHYRVEFSTHHTDKGEVVRGKLFQTGVPHSFIASVPLYANTGCRPQCLSRRRRRRRPRDFLPLHNANRAAQTRHRPPNDAPLHHRANGKNARISGTA